MIRKMDFADWQRKVKVSGGNITRNAELAPVAQ